MKKRIYLDYAASTPVDPRVLRAMQPYFGVRFGNPGSLHSFGQEAIAAVDASREMLAKIIGADFREIIFAASATEANNLALRGIIKGTRHRASAITKPRIIVSAIEHESVLETARDLEREGVEIIYLPVDHAGLIDLKKLKELLNDQTILVSIMYANNEIGAIQPIVEITKIIKEYRGAKKFPLLHTDAAQAFQFLDCNVQNLGVDMMTLSAHKIYGPKGAGALYRGPAVAGLMGVISGGGQEFNFRSGTENVPAIVGFAKAAELIIDSRESGYKKIEKLRDQLWKGIKKIYPKAELNNNSESLPNILNVYFPGYAAQDLLTRFDLHGLAVSSGSACRSRAMESSYVIQALYKESGAGKDRAKSSIRFSLGRPTTKEEIDGALAIMKKILTNHFLP